jgi:hypothetical protein
MSFFSNWVSQLHTPEDVHSPVTSPDSQLHTPEEMILLPCIDFLFNIIMLVKGESIWGSSKARDHTNI